MTIYPPPGTPRRTNSTSIHLATLGGPTTFAGQASDWFCRHQPDLELMGYLPSMADLWQALLSEQVDGIVLSADSTGAGPGNSVRRLLGIASKVFVIHELLMPYRCSLFGKPGTLLDDVHSIVGHGSVEQCRSFLQRYLPDADVRILHEGNSSAAAQLVAEGDGSVAVISTTGAGARFGLVELAADIAPGTIGLWWVIARRPRYDLRPRRLILAGRIRGDGRLGSLVGRVQSLGYRVETAFSVASGEELFTYDYLLTFIGEGETVTALQSQLADFPSLHLVGALPRPACVELSELPPRG